MECHDAQAAISDVLDGAAPDAATLEAAKQHCRECSDCASFVRALNLVKRAPLPEPPADLADRVMAAVRREAAAEQIRVEAAAVACGGDSIAIGTLGSDSPGAPSAIGPGAGGAMPSSPAQGRRRPRPGVVAAWVGAAAVLVASVGTVGVLGVRMMTSEPSLTATRSTMGGAAAPSAAESANQPLAPTAETPTDSAAKAADASAGPSYIVYSATAYQLVGPTKLPKSQFTRVGAVTSSLNGGTLRSRDVLGATGVPGVYLEDDQGELLEFQPLERTFEGRTYRLKAADLTAFGAWPMMPSDVAQPTAADGSPTFSAAGTDPSGIAVYRRTTSTSAEGIAVAPGAPATDAGKGNPNWTWWVPAP